MYGFDPARFLKVAAAELWSDGHFYGQQLIGTFGWANLPLPSWIVFGYAFAVLATVCAMDALALHLRSSRAIVFTLPSRGRDLCDSALHLYELERRRRRED